jgi:hypothetical protein
MIEKIAITVIGCALFLGAIFYSPIKDFNIFKKEAGIVFDANKALENFLKNNQNPLLIENKNLKIM